MSTSPTNESEKLTFGAFDYCVFFALLAIHGLYGIYHAVRRDRHKTVREFMLENKSINPVPVALSVITATLTSVTYLGFPAEAYIFGSAFWLISLNKPLVAVIVSRTFIPVFYRLKVNSIHGYLELRFGRVTSICGAALNFLFIFAATGIIIYAPALALTTVTGLRLGYSIVSVGVVCSFYTMLGGVKAVMWTNIFQTVVILTGFVTTFAVGAITVGGLISVNDIMADVRINIFDPNPTIRTSFWSCFIGGTFIGLSGVASNEHMIQRFLTCRTERQAKNAVWIGFLCIFFVDIIAVFTGVVMYVYYRDCDPYTSGKVEKPEQLIPYFTVDLFSEVYGLSGLFIFSIFGSSLAGVSAQLNAMVNAIGYGVIRPLFPKITKTRYQVITKSMVVVFGACTVVIAFLASHSKSLLQMVLSLIGIITGPLLGVLSLGILCPQSHNKGALTGMAVSFILGVWMLVGSLVYPPVQRTLPLSTELCWPNVTIYTETSLERSIQTITTDSTDRTEFYSTIHSDIPTDMPPHSPEDDYPKIASFYSISYLYYGFMAWGVTFLVGNIVSRFTESDATDMNKDSSLVASIWESYSCCVPKISSKDLYSPPPNKKEKDYDWLGLENDGDDDPDRIQEVEPLNEEENASEV